MTATAFDQSDSDPRLADALEEYSRAVASGQPFDRAAFLARYADLGQRLLDALQAIDVLNDARPHWQPPQSGDRPFDPYRLGDFWIEGELGRGGMGVVYRAVQLSLARPVAVKILPSFLALLERQRERFLTEARVVALLRHPHIVPIYAVDQADGTDYFAMQLVDGPSLARVLRHWQEHQSWGEFRDPRSLTWFRRVAEWIADAADALDFAHEFGVIHRDVKPGNLLVDSAGHLYVTDFGLARVRGGENLTRTGEPPGTPRYMSPEQLSGHRDRVDARTDIYSLGLTLYELLTLRPACPVNDTAEVRSWRRVNQPTPPRTLVPALPRDLETVVYKAMAEDPGDRYATMKALADDLRRWLDGRGVLARRLSPAEHARRWLWRNRRAVSVVTATLVVGTVGGLAWNNGQVRESARLQRQARLDFQDQTARLIDFIERTVKYQEAQSEVRKYLGEYIGLLERTRSEGRDTPETRYFLARAYQYLGISLRTTGDHEASIREFDRAGPLLEGLAAELPRVAKYREELARFCERSALSLGYLQRLEEGLARQRRGLEVWRGLMTDPGPPERYRFRTVIGRTGIAKTLGFLQRLAEARAEYTIAIAELEAICKVEATTVPPRIFLSTAHGSMAWLHEHPGGDPAAVEPHLRAAVAADREIARLMPDRPDARMETRSTPYLLAQLLARRGDLAGAEALLRESLVFARQLSRSHPDQIDVIEGEMKQLKLLATVLDRTNRPDEGLTAWRDAAALCEARIASRTESAAVFRGWLAEILVEAPAGVKDVPRARRLLEEAVVDRPTDWMKCHQLAGVCEQLGDTVSAAAALDQALERSPPEHQRAEIRQRLAKLRPAEPGGP